MGEVGFFLRDTSSRRRLRICTDVAEQGVVTVRYTVRRVADRSGIGNLEI